MLDYIPRVAALVADADTEVAEVARSRGWHVVTSREMAHALAAAERAAAGQERVAADAKSLADVLVVGERAAFEIGLERIARTSRVGPIVVAGVHPDGRQACDKERRGRLFVNLPDRVSLLHVSVEQLTDDVLWHGRKGFSTPPCVPVYWPVLNQVAAEWSRRVDDIREAIHRDPYVSVREFFSDITQDFLWCVNVEPQKLWVWTLASLSRYRATPAPLADALKYSATARVRTDRDSVFPLAAVALVLETHADGWERTAARLADFMDRKMPAAEADTYAETLAWRIVHPLSWWITAAVVTAPFKLAVLPDAFARYRLDAWHGLDAARFVTRRRGEAFADSPAVKDIVAAYREASFFREGREHWLHYPALTARVLDILERRHGVSVWDMPARMLEFCADRSALRLADAECATA